MSIYNNSHYKIIMTIIIFKNYYKYNPSHKIIQKKLNKSI